MTACSFHMHIENMLPFSCDRNAVVQTADLHVKGEPTAACFFCYDLIADASLMIRFLLAKKDDLDRAFPEADVIQCLNRRERDDDAAFHVQNTGTIRLPVLHMERIQSVKRAGIENGVDMTGEENRLAGAILAQYADQRTCAILGNLTGAAYKAFLLQ